MVGSIDVPSALIVDDEPEMLQFLQEFLESRGLNVAFERTVASAVKRIRTDKFVLMIVDMNIPSADDVSAGDTSRYPLSVRFPGVAVAAAARNAGYPVHAVIGYTVHDDDQLGSQLDKIGCRYVVKTRPKILKNLILGALERV